MRILSRFLARSNAARPGLLGGCLTAGIVLTAAAASAQPAAPPPAAPPPAAPPAAAPPPAAPAKPPAAEPLVPTQPAAPVAPAPDVDKDAKALAKQGAERPLPAADVGARPSDVFAEDWWTQARPTFEFHGYYRVRAELFHNFSLGRIDQTSPLWAMPPDNDALYLNDRNGQQVLGQNHRVFLCGSDPTPSAMKSSPCSNSTQAGANMRFRLNPELHISDNLRVMAQIDMLDNLVLGSTPEGYYNRPSSTSTTGYQAAARGGYTPLGAFSTTQWAPVSGVNSTQNSITVKRVWGEYVTPIGVLRFGRMPSHWGLGMVANSGDGHDSDWQSTADRIMFVTGIKKYDLYFAGMWDFANEGATSATFANQQGQPYDLSQYDDVNQFGLVAVRRRNPEAQRLDLAKGNIVVNGGVYFVYRNQYLANDAKNNGAANLGLGASNSNNSGNNYLAGLTRRGAQAYIPDLWLQVLYRKFRFEAEAAMLYGSIENTLSDGANGGLASSNYKNESNPNQNGWKIRQFGITTQSEFRAMEDRLRIQFGFGWASGDPGLSSLKPDESGLTPKTVNGDRTYREFSFHPDYRVDLIFFRNILGRVQGAYYFKPGVEYDFQREKNGQRIGGGASVIWSRASEFIQTPGHARDLGIELDGKLYFQSKDGTLNDDPDKMGGFFTSLEYGVFFPLGGLGYLSQQQTNFSSGGTTTATTLGTSAAQTLRWYMGILF
jgi:uncharacterized protein (TIGR04551 family)